MIEAGTHGVPGLYTVTPVNIVVAHAVERGNQLGNWAFVIIVVPCDNNTWGEIGTIVGVPVFRLIYTGAVGGGF